MKAVVIDSEAKTAEVVDKEWNLDQLQETVKGWVEDVSALKQYVLYVDEEGRFKEHTKGFSVGISPHVIVGTGVVLRREGDHHVELNDEDIERVVNTVHFFERRK